jgi:crotonobetainyl-CoA:carnitine CoA-transferase CaiB-like acyl-CoA transferase
LRAPGLTAVYATTMAPSHRERSGEGQEVEVAMSETMASFMLVEHANGAMFDPPLRPRFSRGRSRRTASRTAPATASFAALIYHDRQWSAPLQTPAALFDDPHLNAVGFFETLDTEHGPVRFPGVPTWSSRTSGHVAGPAPQLGADTAEVLEELGLAPDAEEAAAYGSA